MSNQIGRRRRFYGKSQRKLAEIVGISSSEMNYIELGKHIPNVYVAIRIAKALKITVEELFWEDRENDREKL